MAAIAYGANVDFSGALLYNEGEGEEGNLFDVAETFMSEGVLKVNTIRNITIDMKSGVISAVDGVQDILNDTSILSVGTTSLISMLYNISNLWSNYSISTQHNGETYKFSCEFCSTFGSTIENITNEIDDQIGPIFSDLESTVDSINDGLVDVESTILDQIDSFVDSITDVRDDLSEYEQEVIDYRPDVENANDQRELAYNIIFAVPLLPIIFILFGGILKKPICFFLSYICLWFSCTLMWLLLAIHLPIAVLLNDSCNFLDVIDSNVTATFDNAAGEIFQACLTNEKLTTTLGVGDALNFTNTIEFPSLGNITDQFQFGDFIQFEDDAFNTNFTTFYENGNLALQTINNLTSISPRAQLQGLSMYYTRDNISILNSSAYYTFNTTLQITLEDLKNLLEAESSSISAFNDTIYKIRANLSSVTDLINDIEGDVESLANSVDNASVLLNPLFDSVEDMIDTARCGFIGDAYLDTKAVMCSAVLGSLSRIVISMFVIAILSLFSCIWSFKLVRKVEWWQIQKKEEKDRKLQQSFQPKTNTIVVMQPPGVGQPGNNNIMNQGMYYNQAL